MVMVLHQRGSVQGQAIGHSSQVGVASGRLREFHEAILWNRGVPRQRESDRERRNRRCEEALPRELVGPVGRSLLDRKKDPTDRCAERCCDTSCCTDRDEAHLAKRRSARRAGSGRKSEQQYTLSASLRRVRVNAAEQFASLERPWVTPEAMMEPMGTTGPSLPT